MEHSDLCNLRQIVNERGVLISFAGPFSHGIIEEIGRGVTRYLEAEMLKKAYLMDVFSVFIEQAQNVRHYARKKEDAGVLGQGFNSGIITIGKDGDHHVVCSGNFIDTSDAYANGKNEEMIGRAIKGRRDKAVIATKFGNLGNAVNGKPAYVAEACDKSLKRLDIETIDIYFQHRVDADVPIEDTIGAMKRLVEQGKVRWLGSSNFSPEQVEGAERVASASGRARAAGGASMPPAISRPSSAAATSGGRNPVIFPS